MLDELIENIGIRIDVLCERISEKIHRPLDVSTLYLYRTERKPTPRDVCEAVGEIAAANHVACDVEKLAKAMRSDEHRGPGRPKAKPAKVTPITHRQGVPVLQLLTDHGVFVDFERTPGEAMVRVPISARIAAGDPGDYEELEPGEAVDVPRSWMPRHKLELVRVAGGSMSDSRIRAGVLVGVRRTSEASDRDIVIVRIPGYGTTLKRYRKPGKGKPFLQADSKEHRDIPITGEIEILGKVERIYDEYSPDDPHPVNERPNGPRTKKTRK